MGRSKKKSAPTETTENVTDTAAPTPTPSPAPTTSNSKKAKKAKVETPTASTPATNGGKSQEKKVKSEETSDASKAKAKKAKNAKKPDPSSEGMDADFAALSEAERTDEYQKALRSHDINIFNIGERLEQFSRFQRSLLQPEAREVLKKFVYASLCMLVLPIASFFMACDVFASQGYDHNTSLTYGACVAGLVVQVVAFGYVYIAILEEREINAKKALLEGKKTK